MKQCKRLEQILKRKSGATSMEIMALLQQLNREGITIVLVTHEHDVAAFAGRIINFRDGRVVQDHANTPADAVAMLQ